jgi:hypothetical protein
VVDEIDWVTSQIEKAKGSHPVTEAVSTRLVELLKGPLSKGQLKTAEATIIAGQLILDITPPNPATAEDK